MQILSAVEDVRQQVTHWKGQEESIAFVPTMGDLHAGHLALITEARKFQRVVVSIFVNPLQFGEGEDYQNYPRSDRADREKLAACKVDLLYCPTVEALYPDGTHNCTHIEIPVLGNQLCGKSRPGHFSGVATVVCKLLNIIQPDVAIFGEKDYQQLLVIRKLVADLNIPVKIEGVPTVREKDGLAMSSRNRYLSEEERKLAPRLYRILFDLAETLSQSSGGIAAMKPCITEAAGLLTSNGFAVDYLEVRREQDLGMPQPEDRYLRLFVAAWLGKARLIDNLPILRQNVA
ncbi:MAG: pantoate--beta-alanine ligase [Gammaproteobacteria bacterium]|nr:MAG: pantoate--beta-alanine ligase [Gammaproteobacteria bacterium]